jgi:hypothetical protein
MTIVIKNTTSNKAINKTIESPQAKKTSKGLRKHFGVLKRGIDGLEYQKKIRNGF